MIDAEALGDDVGCNYYDDCCGDCHDVDLSVPVQ